jgi:dihydroxyacid dehydratase/phosphogluconate dehydratase
VAARLKNWSASTTQEKGYLSRYAALVTSASRGAVLKAAK